VIINSPKKETVFRVFFPSSVNICKHILSFELAKVFPWLPHSSFILRSPLVEKKSAVIKYQIVFVSEAVQRRFTI